MRIIGEKINGTRALVKKAVGERDSAIIQDLATRQVEGGAFWLDVHAGTPPEREPDDLIWLVRTVQQATDAPLCLDSTNPDALKAAIREVHCPPLINSVSAEPGRMDGILPLLQGSNCGIIALAMDGRGIPATAEERVQVIRSLVAEMRHLGIRDDQMYVDPLVMAVAAKPDGALITLDTIRAVHIEFPNVHITSGLSNVSYGLPARTLVNQAFLTLAVLAGLDTAILDPLDRDLRKALLATEVVLGHDRHCLNYLRSFRAGLLS
jgi:cobalamin-dependent methionine synthase I